MAERSTAEDPTAEDPTLELSALEHAWMRAWRERDRATLERVLADDFLLMSATGRLMNRQEWLAGALGAFVCHEFIWEELRVRPVGAAGDVAIVHGQAWQQAQIGERNWSGTFLVTDVWVRRDGAWRVVARHGTGPIPPAAERDEGPFVER